MTNSEIEQIALEKGFGRVYFLPPKPISSEKTELVQDPNQALEGVKTIIALIMPYLPAEEYNGNESVISPYYIASNLAYHRAKEMNEILIQAGHRAIFGVQMPIKKLLLTYGIGTIGRNTLIAIKGLGSRFHVQLILTDAKFEYNCVETAYDFPALRCKNCHRCVDACPNGAIMPNVRIEISRCLRFISECEPIPYEFESKLGNKLLGCEVCQDACPANMGLKKIQPITYELKRLLNGDINELKELIGVNNARSMKLKKKAAVIAANLNRTDLIDDIRQQATGEDESLKIAMNHALDRLEDAK